MASTNNYDEVVQQLPEGMQVGEYVVERQIGEGGFGSVYLAEHPLIGKQVAIKVLAPQFSADPEMVSRFMAEARAVNQIRHRNIIDIFSFGKLEDGRQYYIMEYLAGRPLDEYLDSHGAVPVEDALPILRAIAKALDAAHAKGIAHRDLKPENVFLVDVDGEPPFPKLLDFGIAKLLHKDETKSHKTRTGAPIGTPAYMSPEQCRGKNVDHRTDIYAFGILTYVMLTGELPFDGEDYMDVIFKQIGEEPKRPSQTTAMLAASLDAAVLAMLAKDPDNRPSSLSAAMDDLTAAARELGVAVPVSRQYTPPPMNRVPTGMRSADDTMLAGVADDIDGDADTVAGAAANSGRQGKVAFALVGAALLATVGGFWVFNGSGGADVGRAQTAKPTAVVVDAPAADAALAQQQTPPPQSKFVELLFSDVPDGTEVYGPAGILGVTPGKIQLERGNDPVVLTLKASGFKPGSVEIVPDDSKPVDVELVELAERAQPKSKKRRKRRKPKQGRGKKTNRLLENPF